MPETIFGGNDGDYYYVESAENSPTSLANTPDLEGHISKLETMYKVSEGEIDAIVRPTVIFYHTKQLGILELANAETDPYKNLQDNGATLPVGTKPLLPHSSLC